MDRQATAIWKGALKDGQGTLDTQSGALKGLPLQFKARFEDASGTSGTTLRNCWARPMRVASPCSFHISSRKTAPKAEKLEAKAVVTLDPAKGAITKSALTLVGNVPGIDAATFSELANKAKANCPVSKALGAIELTLDARLA